ncbi:MAG: hypothetical protein WC249_01360 [Patescibacteria group bacterium]|jgi:hypothetical protein
MTKIINGHAAPLSIPVNRHSFNLKYFNAVLFASLAGLGVFYLVLINDLTVHGFLLQKLNSQEANLVSINMSNQEQVNMAQSYLSLKDRLQNLNLVAVDNVEYLSVHDLAVAKK